MPIFKSVFTFLLIFNTFYVASQEVVLDTTALPYLQKAEFSVLGMGMHYEVPLSKVLALDSGIGFSSGATIVNDALKFKKELWNPSIYIKSELKYYYNRYVRVAKKLVTKNGEGSYFGVQSKFLTQRLLDSKEPLSNILMNELHWGIQRNLYPDFLINLHVGIGYANDFTSSGDTFYTAMGVKVAYVFAAKKITKTSFDKFRF